ncbi:MAG: hypothetical protein IJS37_02760 [Bacilli bacterium]|nr:hypothetical protein [Bacilli bacterium]
MNRKNTYILMCKNDEVLSFHVDFRKSKVTFIEKLEHFDKAPHGINGTDKEINDRLSRFIHTRTIPAERRGYKEILKATHCRNGFSLSFKGHGLSLSNHYWYKKPGENLRYEDINFFVNTWDDSFARAILRGDYEALSCVDLNVPDIVTAGWGVKGWIYDEKKGPRLYKMGIHDESPDEALGEVLASRLAQRLFKKEEVLQYDLEKIEGKYASVSLPMISVDEELIPLTHYLPFEMYQVYHGYTMDKKAFMRFLDMLKDGGYSDLYTFFVKLNCLKSLCFVSDLHFGNISVLKNMKTGDIRVAPLYDLGGSFGSGSTAKKFLANPDKSTLLLAYFIYTNLDPEWDYSWYDKDRLIGFEDEIRRVLSKSDFYKPDIIDFVVELYRQQKSSLDEMASRSPKR